MLSKDFHQGFERKKKDIESLTVCNQAVLLSAEDLIGLDAKLGQIESYLENIQKHILQERAGLDRLIAFQDKLRMQCEKIEALRKLSPQEIPEPKSNVLQPIEIAKVTKNLRRAPSSRPIPQRRRAETPAVTNTPAVSRQAKPEEIPFESLPISTPSPIDDPPAAAAPVKRMVPSATPRQPRPTAPRVRPTKAVEVSSEAEGPASSGRERSMSCSSAENKAICAGDAQGVEEEYGKCIHYITEDEMKTIPDYMKGRLDYHRVNELIDKFNSILKKKYTLLRLPPKKMNERQVAECQAFMAEETALSKKQIWFSENDIRLAGDIKNDNTLKSTMMILRHLGRMTRDNKRHIVLNRS